MDEKKIFLAYIYRCLNKLYTHLYLVRADRYFDSIFLYISDYQCCSKYILATPLASLAFHYRICKQAHELYNKDLPPSRLCNIIDKLLQNQTPALEEAMEAGLIEYRIDRFNPIFKSYFDN